LYGQSNGARPENVAQIQQRFPYLRERRDLVDGQTFLFADTPGDITWYDRDTVASITPGHAFGPWGVAGDLPMVLDTAAHPVAWDYSGRDFGIDLSLALDTLMLDPQEQLEVIAQVTGFNDVADAAIILDVKAGDSTVFYRGGDLRPLLRSAGRTSLIAAMRPADAGRDNGPMVVKTYVYNRNKGPLHITRIDVLRRRANPIVYGTLEPVPWLGRFR
ncbi:MAG: hypothetical protein KA230_10345, partial [Flavobacteriales bacterium]|nr:hypothetical protein [Flavobacteriales bacterium]